jgi:hypothetical protein
MEREYWLGRKRMSLAMAQNAGSSEARLAHYDLAGRYSVKASNAEIMAFPLADALPPSLRAGRPTVSSREPLDA